MTDRINHRAAAERMLADAREWGWQADEPMPEAGELSCLAYAAVHALLAIHDALTVADRYAANEARQREEAEPEMPEAAEWLSRSGPDPLDESDHRDRVDWSGDLVRRKPNGHWAWVAPGLNAVDGWTLSSLNAFHGPLAFAPEPPPDAAGDDLTASESASGSVEGEALHDAPEAGTDG